VLRRPVELNEWMTTVLPDPVEALIDAANDNDVSRFLALFTTDGVVDDWGREFAGIDAIRGWSDREFLGVQVSLAVTDVTQHGDEVEIGAVVGGKGFNGTSHFSFRTDGDKIARMTIRA
jgi:hypothetical protein